MTLRCRAGRASLPFSANGRAFLVCCLECPCIPDGRAGKGNARPAAGQDRDNWVEGVKLGGNRAPARGRNRISRPEPMPLAAALAGFLGPARMAGGTQHSNVVRGGVSGLCPSTPTSVIGQTKAWPLAGVSPFAMPIWGLIMGAAARLATLGLVRPLSCRYADAAGQAGMPMAVKVKAGAQAPA